ncbi:MAG: SurA N-terminal domain-containing protein [Dissulfurimicrobium sp.]|uniref:SurA N-terminal domain-containing protein n=1 Tax=Dissulfurimicrobium sp. TaxID=2022436 RepID=UPI004049CA92
MLDLIRRKASSWLLKFILGVIAIVFIFWGIGNFHSQRTDTVANINGEKISIEAYRSAYADIIEHYKQMFKGKIPEGLLEKLNVKQQAMDDLIQQTLVRQAADKMGIRISNEELQKIIAGIPAFQHEGAFNKTLYERVLRGQRMTPASFENKLRDELLTERMVGLLSAGLMIPDDEAKDYYMYENQQIDLDYVMLDANECRNDAKVTDQDIAAWYEAHKETFRTAPQISLNYLFFDQEGLLKDINASDEEAKNYYQEHAAEFAKDKTKPAAPDNLRPFDEVKDEIITRIKAAKAKNLAWDKANNAYNEIIELGSLTEYAKRHNIKLEVTGLFSEKTQPQGLVLGPNDASQLFNLGKGELSSIIETPKGMLIAQVAEKKMPYIRPLDEVKDRVHDAVLNEKSKELCRAKAAKLLKAAKENGIDKAADAMGLKVLRTGLFKRSDITANGKLPIQATKAGLSLYEDKRLPDEVVDTGDKFYVLSFKEKKDADLSDFPGHKDEIAKRILSQKQRILIKDWLADLKAKAKININNKAGI